MQRQSRCIALKFMSDNFLFQVANIVTLQDVANIWHVPLMLRVDYITLTIMWNQSLTKVVLVGL